MQYAFCQVITTSGTTYHVVPVSNGRGASAGEISKQIKDFLHRKGTLDINIIRFLEESPVFHQTLPIKKI